MDEQQNGAGVLYKGYTYIYKVELTSVSTGGNHTLANLGFNASHFNSVYGSSSTVTPLSLTSQFFIHY